MYFSNQYIFILHIYDFFYSLTNFSKEYIWRNPSLVKDKYTLKENEEKAFQPKKQNTLRSSRGCIDYVYAKKL